MSSYFLLCDTCYNLYSIDVAYWLELASVGFGRLNSQCCRQRSAGQSRATTTADTLGITVAMSAMSAMSKCVEKSGSFMEFHG